MGETSGITLARAPWAVGVALVSAAYFGSAKLGLELAFRNSSVTEVWPPTGIALAALLLGGLRLWPGVALGAFLANTFWTDAPFVSVLGITTGNTLEALVAAYILMRVVGFDPSLERMKDVLGLVAIGALLSTTVSATIGVASLWIGGALSGVDIASLWRIWWTGDMGGALLVAPFLLVFARHVRVRRPPHVLEATGMLVLLTTLCAFILSRSEPLAYLVFPGIIWAALRFGPRGATAASLIVASISVWLTKEGTGAFVQGSLDDSLLRSQTFMAVASVTALMLAAVTTERRRAEEALQNARDELELKVLGRTAELEQTNAELADAQQMAGMGSWEWDISEDVVSWSEELYRITGIDPEHCPASFAAYLDRVHPDDRAVVDAVAQKMYADRSSADFEHRIVRPDGTVRFLHGRGKVVTDETGRPIRMYGTVQDVTEEKQAREEADRLKDDFLALVSHELRTPLTSIRGYLEVLLDDEDGELNEGQRESAEIAYRNASRLQELVGDLLTLSKLESDAIRLQRRPVDLALIARELEQEFRPTASQKKIRIEVAAEEGALVFGDPLRLGQSLSNLLSNAIKFSPEGGTVELRCRRTSAEVTLEVEDSGVGIPENELARIGQRFYRASSADTIQGTGLGLAIAREIVERHGGRLEVESELGVGSTFRARLPIDQRRGLELDDSDDPRAKPYAALAARSAA